MCDLNKFSCINGFAEELDELVYEGMSNWFVSFRSVVTLYSAHFSYLLVHICMLACGILTFKHANANGSRFVQFWWGAMMHGIISECGPTSTRYWHAQAPIMLFGKRLPLHTVFFYPTILYLPMMAVQKFKMNPCSEPPAVGLLAMMMDVPFRIISVRFLHITYHDSDPMYASKFYGVPWIEIFSSLVSMTSFAGSYYALKYNLLSEDHIKWERVEYDQKEYMVTAASSLLSPISAFMQKIIFFYVLHDSFNVNPSSCLFFLSAVYCSIIFSLVETTESKEEDNKETEAKSLLYYTLAIYVVCLLYISMVLRSQNEISIGTHEPTGDCTTLICSRTPLGKVTKRKKYLCVDDVQERSNFVYNFECLPEGPPYLNAIWYTICGTAIRNRAQLLTNIFGFTILSSTIIIKGLIADEEIEWIQRKLLEWKITELWPLGRQQRDRVTFEESQSEEAEEVEE